MARGSLTKARVNPTALQGAVLIALAWVSVVAAVVLGPVLPQIGRVFAGETDLGVKVALVATGPALLVAALSVPCGMLADRIGRRSLLLVSLLLYGIAGVAPFWLTALDQIVAARLLVGLAEAAIMTCSTALIIDYFHGPEREKWLAVQAGAAPVMAVCCSLLGAALSGFGWRVPFAAYTLGFIFLPFVFFLIWEPAWVSASPSMRATAEKDDFSWIKPMAIAVVVVFSMILFMVPIVQFGFLVSERGVTAAPLIGLWGALVTAGIPAGASLFSLIRARTGGKLLIAYLLFGTGFLLMGLVNTVPAAIVGGFVASAGGGLMMPTAIVWLLSDIPARLRGRGAGLWTAANFLGQFLSPLAVLGLAIMTGALSVALTVCALASLGAASLVAMSMIVGGRMNAQRGQET